MRLSIIVTFNKGLSYLEDCLDSIICQHISEYEVIIIGDCPEPGTEQIVKKYTDQLPLSYYELCMGDEKSIINGLTRDNQLTANNEINANENCDCINHLPKGVAAARNLGLSYAAGESILFLDSDDYLDDGCIEALLNTHIELVTRPEDNSKRRLIRAIQQKTWYKRFSFMQEKQVLTSQSEAHNHNQKDAEQGSTIVAELQGADSVLGILIPLALIRQIGLTFNEELIYYSDLPFINRLISEAGIAECKDAKYIKRSHNDAVRLPSLTQTLDERKPEEFLESFKQAYNSSAGVNRMYLERYLLSHVLSKLIKGKHPEGIEWPDYRLLAYAGLLKLVREEIKEGYPYLVRRLIKLLINERLRRARTTARLIVFGHKKSGFFGSRLQWKWAVYKRIFRRMSVKRNWVLFESFLGKSYGDSCKSIYQYMISVFSENKLSRRKLKYIWIINNRTAKIPGKHTEVKPLSLRYFYYIARSGYWINNMRQPTWYEKRPGVCLVETWHGTPLKKLVFDMDDVHSASPEYKMHFYKQSRMWDYLISDNSFSTEVFKSAFLFPQEQILEFGYPRNDLLYNELDRAGEIKQKLNIPSGKKVVLYAPTWRDDEYYGPGQYKFELPLNLDMMRQIKEEYFFILRTHYFISDNLHINEKDRDFVMDCSRYNDIGELFLISDICITDYSSVFFDYANLKRPILFFVYDFEKYRDVLRGFYIDMETELPGPLLFTNEEVLRTLKNINMVIDEYKENYERFYDRFCSLDDGHAAERVVKRIFG